MMVNSHSPSSAAPAAAETRFDRASGLTLLGVLALATLIVASTLAVLARPADGWLIPYDSPAATLSYFYGDWPTPLQAGDVVLAVEGAPLVTLYSLQQAVPPPPNWRAGAQVVYTVQRGAQTLAVPVDLHAPTGAVIARALAHTAQDVPAEWSWPLVALVVFWQRPRSLAARLLLLAMVSHAAVVKLGWASTSVGLYLAPTALLAMVLFLNNFWIWLFWPTVIWLVLSFPLPVWPWARWPRAVPALLYGLPLAAALLMLTTGIDAAVVATLVAELLLLVVALGLAVRQAYRPSVGPVARAQAGWVLLGLGLSQGLTLLLYLLLDAVPALAGLPTWVTTWVTTPLTLALPICLGIAILRYRLFDINIIIRRTLLYAGLTAILALTYWGLVVVLQNVLRPVTGQGQNQVVVVASTLVIAALFGPLRRRVQAAIDRRFDRRTYDAARTLAAFGAEARAETDLAALQARLERVTDETMRPAHVSVWFAPDKR